MASDVKKEFGKLSDKYALPKFNELDLEFEINDLESVNFVLRNVLRKIAEKLEFYCNMINDLLQPDASSLSGMHETRFFMDDDKVKIYNLYKRMMKSYRAIIALVLGHDERKQAEFLNDFFKEWSQIKKELLAYVDQMKESWDKETTMENDLRYFG